MEKMGSFCGLDKIPIFIRKGAMIPNKPVSNMLGEHGIKEIGFWMCNYRQKRGGNLTVFYEDGQDGLIYKKEGTAFSIS